MPWKILATGSPPWDNYEKVYAGLKQCGEMGGTSEVTVVIGNRRGPLDTLIQQAADSLGYSVEYHPQSWIRYGNGLGENWSTRMGALHDMGIHICLFFEVPGTRGGVQVGRYALDSGLEMVRFSTFDR